MTKRAVSWRLDSLQTPGGQKAAGSQGSLQYHVCPACTPGTCTATSLVRRLPSQQVAKRRSEPEAASHAQCLPSLPPGRACAPLPSDTPPGGSPSMAWNVSSTCGLGPPSPATIGCPVPAGSLSPTESQGQPLHQIWGIKNTTGVIFFF